ncbi:MAG: alpha/beta hydrolase [Verrucomicrobia bacterium]|jgi:acetyl esterase/lipase|nr:alpha/beta hydrolase [Verrucomicrobiota bacterium]
MSINPPLLGFVFLLQTASAAVSPPINLKPDIVYKMTPQGELCLDLYYPETELSGNYPVVIYTHGGGWAAGSKKGAGGRAPIGRVVRSLTEEGFCVAAVGYRLCKADSGITIRDCVTDAKDAIRYLSKNSEELFVDADRVFTFGDSAGGQMAQMLLLASPECFPGAEELAGNGYTMVAGVSWYGPCDFEKIELFSHEGNPRVRDRFGGRIVGQNTAPADKLRLYREVSPVNYLTKDSPPLLMIQADKDTTIPVHHAHYMKERAEAIGAPVDIMIVKNAGHNWRKADGVTPVEPSHNEIIERTVDFLANCKLKTED